MTHRIKSSEINSTSLRMIWMALISGLVMFGIIAFFIRNPAATGTGSNGMLSMVGLVVAIACWTTGLIMPRFFSPRARKGDMLQPGRMQHRNVDKSDGTYVVQCLVRWAMFEGAGMFGGVLTIITPSYVPIAVLAVSVALLLGTGPRPGRLGPPKV